MIQHPPRARYVLEGRVATMSERGVINDGAVYIDGGTIEHVRQRTAKLPDDKYRGATRIRTGGTIFPGFIELHNHLAYNAMPLWEVPTRYTNNGQWRGTEPYTRRITKPSQVLGQSNGAAQALVRYTECRALLGGTTCSQGLTLANAGGVTKLYAGLLRNPEAPDDDRLPPAGTNIANPETGGALAYLETLAGHSCYLQHLSEGTDTTARGWFERLKIEEERWAVNDRLCAIHCTALHADDFRRLARGGATMVWSPLSNYLLYGDTADIGSAKEAELPISLGSDWAPSGSKNLLGEIKVAWLASREHGGVFEPRELVEMITTNPARALKWESLLGSIEPGKLADLVVVDGQSDDAYLSLIHARESTITLVLIGGVPRVGQSRLMGRFWDEPLQGADWLDELHIGDASRRLFFEQADDVLEGLQLSTALETLRGAMARLPELAVDVDSAVAGAVAGVDGPGSFAGGVAVNGDTFRVVPDFEAEDDALARRHARRRGSRRAVLVLGHRAADPRSAHGRRRRPASAGAAAGPQPAGVRQARAARPLRHRAPSARLRVVPGGRRSRPATPRHDDRSGQRPRLLRTAHAGGPQADRRSGDRAAHRRLRAPAPEAGDACRRSGAAAAPLAPEPR